MAMLNRARPFRRTADPARGIVAGMLAGLAAAAAMDAFQMLVAGALPASDAPPATEQAADAVARAVTGSPVPQADKAVAGIAVHYVFAALIGAVYGGLAERRSSVTGGRGSLLGAFGAVVFDEIGTPVAGLAPPPSRTAPIVHAYAFASHQVFGVVIEAVRRLLRG